VEPPHGSTAGGTELHITGAGFAYVTQVLIGGKECQIFEPMTKDGELTCYSPALPQLRGRRSGHEVEVWFTSGHRAQWRGKLFRTYERFTPFINYVRQQALPVMNNVSWSGDLLKELELNQQEIFLDTGEKRNATEIMHAYLGTGIEVLADKGGREEFRCDIIETPTRYDGAGVPKKPQHIWCAKWLWELQQVGTPLEENRAQHLSSAGYYNFTYVMQDGETGNGHGRNRWDAYLNTHHLHPIFVDGRGASHTPLQTQSALLFLLLNRVSHPAIQRILALNRKAIEDMEKRLNHLRKGWVEEKEQSIIFGNGKDWIDVEADEATFSSTDLKQLADNPEQPIIWEQWCGIVQRGSPHTLLLKRLSPQTSARRAPGPGAIRNMERRPLATKHLQDRAIVLHTDAAKSYKLKVSGVLHDQVRHCKKRVKVKGKWVWKMPTYVKIATHKDPKTGRQFKTKGGTQIIDRAWRFLKDRIQLNQHCR
ncbi:Chaperone protein DnaJ, partial [Durusdinium trenchii]